MGCGTHLHHVAVLVAFLGGCMALIVWYAVDRWAAEFDDSVRGCVPRTG
jgi:hypothetical protein